MNKKKTFNSDIFKRWRMQPFKIMMFMLFALLLMIPAAFGQVANPNDPSNWDPYLNFTTRILDFKGESGDVVKMPLVMRNIYNVSGFLFRIEYDTTMLVPYKLPGYTPESGVTVWYDSVEVTGRGTGTITIDSASNCVSPINPIDTSYNVYATHDTALTNNPHRNAVFIQFLPPIRMPLDIPECEALWRDASIASAQQASTVLYLLWQVKPGLANGQSSTVRFWDYRPSDVLIDPPADYRDNQISDSLGRVFYPYRYSGTFTVGTSSTFDPADCPVPYWYDAEADTCYTPTGGDNHAPTINAISPSTFTVTQGEAVPSVTVTATDVDGDVVTLTASSMPSGATFSPANPVSGTGTVSGVFNWTPSLSTEAGTYVVNFRATDSKGAQSSIRSITIIVEAIDIDRLYTKSAYGGKPVGGIPGAGPFAFPIDLVTTKTVYGIDFYMAYPSTIVDLDSIVVTSRTPEYVVYENIGQFPDTVKIVTFGLANEIIGNPDAIDGTAILKAFMTIDSAAVPGDYWVYLYDAWESIDPDPEIASLALLTDSGVVQVDMMGDVNLDKRINVADLVNVVGHIIGNITLGGRHYATANVVLDPRVNVVDLVGIINMIFGRPISPSPAPSGDNRATVTLAQGALSAGQYTKLNIAGEFLEAVAGVQLEINYDPATFSMDRPELPQGVSGVSLSYNDDKQGSIKMVMYSTQPLKNPSIINAGLSEIVNLPTIVKRDVLADDISKIRLSKVYLANANAVEIAVDGASDEPMVPSSFTLHQNYPNPFNPFTTIEFDIAADGSGMQDVELSIFNILGQKVRTLVNEPLMPGHHLAEWDSMSDSNKPVATGVYLYRLKIGEKHQTKKMILLK